MYLSFSGYKKKRDCGFAYWNEYINKTRTGEPDDRLGSIYGSVVGRLFEEFYKDKLWRMGNPQETLMNRVEATVNEIIRRETTPWKDKPGGVLLWKGEGPGQNPQGMYTDREELIADVRDTIPRGFRIIRQHRLVGPRTDAEFKLDYVTENKDILGGRADFIIDRVPPQSDTVIVDGKGSRHRGKYVDPQQLQWYAMLFWKHTGKLPDKLAFLFWRYGPDECMDWLDVVEDDVAELYETANDTIKGIQTSEKMLLPGSSPEVARGVFLPKANDKNCRFCPYASLCPPGQKIQEKLKSKRAPR